LLVSVALVGLSLTLPAADWPGFLGPNGDNTSPETDLLDRWPEDGPPVIWQKSVGTGYSAPSVRGGLLVVHHRTGNEELVDAMNATNGERRWQHTDASNFRDPYGYNNGPRSTPLLTSNRCYVVGAEGRITCMDLADGRVCWQRDTAKDWNVPEAFFGVGSSPLLVDGKLILMIGGQPNSGVVALNPESGKTLWESVGRDTWNGVEPIGWPTTKPYEWRGWEQMTSYSSPKAASIHGQPHLFCLMRQGLVSLNPADGTVRWSRWFQAQVNESVNAMTPVVDDDVVFISAAYYRVGSVALRVNRQGNGFEEVWRSPKDRSDRDPVMEIHWNTPVLHNGYLYGFSGRNEPDASFRCVELRTGRLMWSRDESWGTRSSKQPPVYGRGSAILADGKLIVLGEGGKLGMFRLNPEQDEELCSWQMPQLRYPCWAGPVLANGKLYLRSEDRLVCLNLKETR
jgi:outer membrane protein assembly factor BamB